MPVSEQTPYEEYIANGVSTRFPLGFMCKDSKHLIVKVADQEALPGEWFLDQQDVVFYTAPKAESVISIKRNTPLARTTKYSLYDNSFRPQAINDDMDFVWLKMQELLVEKNLLEIKASKDDDFLKEFLLQVITDAGLQMDQLRELFDSKNYAYDQLIAALKNTIDVAAAAGAGSKGWLAKLVAYRDKTQEDFNNQLDEKLKRENVSVWDFFTSTEYATYKAAPTLFDAYRPLQAFFDDIAVNNYGVAYCSGIFRTSKELTFTVPDGLKSTRTAIGELDLQALSSIESIITITANQDFNWYGKLIVRGTGSTSINSRTCKNGIVLNGSARCYFNKLVARNFYNAGVYVPDKGTLCEIRSIRTSDCGSGHADAYSQITAFTNIERIGSFGSVAQRQKIRVAELPKTDSLAYYHIIIDGQPYYVSETDRDTKTLSIFPWLPNNKNEGSLKYLYGGGVLIYGGDSSEMMINTIDAVRTSVAFLNGALYSTNINILQTQNCGVAMQFGSSPGSATIGGYIGNIYCEANSIDILRATRAEASFNIISGVSLDLAKTKFSCAARSSNDELITYNNLNGITTPKNGQYIGRSTVGNYELSNPQEATIYGNTLSANLTIDDSILKAYETIPAKKLIFIGSGTNNQPTSSVTLIAPVGYYLNGGDNLVFSNLSRPLELTFGLRLGTKNIIVSSNHMATLSIPYYPPQILAGESISTTITMSGTKIGDIVHAAFSQYNPNIEMKAIVTTADTILISFKNNGSSPIMISGTINVKKL